MVVGDGHWGGWGACIAPVLFMIQKAAMVRLTLRGSLFMRHAPPRSCRVLEAAAARQSRVTLNAKQALRRMSLGGGRYANRLIKHGLAAS